jgi:protein-S-isoprenylcysteine O-methyltransferase Ste14
MSTPFWLNAVLRALVWVGATVFLAWLRKPEGVAFTAIRADAVGWTGLGLIAAGLACHAWSNLTLLRGERAAARGAATIVSDGPYRFVRHPIYLAGVPLLSGAALLYAPPSGADLVGAVVVLAVFHWRVIRAEEPALRRRFGAEYEEYCRRVPRWLPRVGG